MHTLFGGRAGKKRAVLHAALLQTAPTRHIKGEWTKPLKKLHSKQEINWEQELKTEETLQHTLVKKED